MSVTTTPPVPSSETIETAGIKRTRTTDIDVISLLRAILIEAKMTNRFLSSITDEELEGIRKDAER